MNILTSRDVCFQMVGRTKAYKIGLIIVQDNPKIQAIMNRLVAIASSSAPKYGWHQHGYRPTIRNLTEIDRY